MSAERRAWRQKKLKDPKWAAEEKRKRREYYLRVKDTPEYRKYRQDHERTYRKKVSAQVYGNRLKRFGLTLETYTKLLRQQRHRCAICKRHQRQFQRRFAVDHNHKTGKVRHCCAGLAIWGWGI